MIKQNKYLLSKCYIWGTAFHTVGDVKVSKTWLFSEFTISQQESLTYES